MLRKESVSGTVAKANICRIKPLMWVLLEIVDEGIKFPKTLLKYEH